MGPSSASRARSTAPAAASDGSPPTAAARSLRPVARRRFVGGGCGRYETVSSSVDFGQLVVARLRAGDRYPRDAELTWLLDKLRAGSAEFTEL